MIGRSGRKGDGGRGEAAGLSEADMRNEVLAGADDAARMAEAAADPIVAALLASFPGAELADVAPPERSLHAQSR